MKNGFSNPLQNEVLTDLITRLSIELKLPQSERNTYALKFEDPGNDGVFLTKENRGLVPQGFILILTASPVLFILFLLFFMIIKLKSPFLL